MADDFNARMDRLEALVERMATSSSQAPPVVNVNVSLGDLLKKRKSSGALESPDTQTPDTPEPGGYPRPYVS